MSKHGVISGPYFPVFGLNTERSYLTVFSPNTGKYEPEINLYLDTFHAVPLKKCSIFADLLMEKPVNSFAIAKM